MSIQNHTSEHGEGGWFWLSFADFQLPAGNQFLGVVIVQATHLIDAIKVTHILGCNPGGEVRSLPILKDVPVAMYAVLDQWRDRLLTRDQCSRVDTELMAARDNQ